MYKIDRGIPIYGEDYDMARKTILMMQKGDSVFLDNQYQLNAFVKVAKDFDADIDYIDEANGFRVWFNERKNQSASYKVLAYIEQKKSVTKTDLLRKFRSIKKEKMEEILKSLYCQSKVVFYSDSNKNGRPANVILLNKRDLSYDREGQA